jgi:hypothetical protein
MLTVCFAVISLLYATVGQAGGTVFLALMAFASFPSNEMRPGPVRAASYSPMGLRVTPRKAQGRALGRN